MLEKTFHIRLVGDPPVRAVGGAAQDDAPYPFLFNLRGTNAWSAPGHGQRLRDHGPERLPGRPLRGPARAAQLRHPAGEGKGFQPRPGLAFNAGIGGLARPELHDGFTFSAFDRGYYEAGVVVDDLLKLGFTGLGGGLPPLGPYATGDLDQDLAVKLALSPILNLGRWPGSRSFGRKAPVRRRGLFPCLRCGPGSPAESCVTAPGSSWSSGSSPCSWAAWPATWR